MLGFVFFKISAFYKMEIIKAKSEKGMIPSSDVVVKYIQNNTKNFSTVSGNASLIRDNIVNIKPLVRIIEDGKPVDAKPVR